MCSGLLGDVDGKKRMDESRGQGPSVFGLHEVLQRLVLVVGIGCQCPFFPHNDLSQQQMRK